MNIEPAHSSAINFRAGLMLRDPFCCWIQNRLQIGVQ